jgi:hypothetical protein
MTVPFLPFTADELLTPGEPPKLLIAAAMSFELLHMLMVISLHNVCLIISIVISPLGTKL